MCGIAGFAGSRAEGINEETAAKMLSTMTRRGPDANGAVRDENVLLLHARLAVISPETGAQPMSVISDECRYTIVYNGELYNTEELRNDLMAKGVRFTTASDTEVLLRAYITYGEKCLERLNGIYAFAVWNHKEKSLFFARDRLGVKPFFYSFDGDTFAFASEIKTLLASETVRPIIDADGAAELFLTGPGRTPGSCAFRDIKELKPGYCGMWKKGGITLKPYWRLEDRGHTDSLQDTVCRVNALVRDAVERQLVSDVPIGTFLSGGLDSSLISSIANRYMKRRGKRLITFSVSYKDNDKYFKPSHFQPNSDDKYIKLMREYLDCDYVDVVLDTEELAAALDDAVRARDLPGMADVDSSLLLFCKEIKKHVTVALSGECADEIFGGYPWYRDREVLMRYGFPWSNNYDYRASFMNPDIASHIDPRAYISERYERYCKEAPKHEGLSDYESRMREMSYLNMYWFMQTLLDRKDRMSMYSGLEVRVPFCDHRIAEYLYSVPFEMKELDGYEKGLLRTAFDGYLPEEVLWRKKSPYPKTHNPAYLSAVISLLALVLDDPSSPIHALADADRIRGLFTSTDALPWYGQLMTVPQTIAYFYMLNTWLKEYNVEIRI